MMKSYKAPQGFTLLEVLISFMVLSFGLLGAVALQAQAKKASFDSMQRAAAVSLGEDIIQRIRANDTLQIVNLYSQTFTSETPLESLPDCFTPSCNAELIAKTDLEVWKTAIRAKENTGSLDDAAVCIGIIPQVNTDGKGFNIRVVVSWRGRQEFVATDATKAIQCGTNDDRRRLVVMDSYILVRN